MSEESLQGCLLVASPDLRDPNFYQSVVLVLRHDREGAFGLILNRPTDTSIKQVWQQVSQAPCGSDEMLRLGGPVEGPLLAIHSLEAFSEDEILPGVYCCAELSKVEQLVAEPKEHVRLFIGYAGWGAGQLETELKAGSWLIVPATFDYVFRNDPQLWLSLNRKVSGARMTSMLGIKHVPDDPSMN